MQVSQLLSILSVLFFISACATRITCKPDEITANVALIDHGRHASLVLLDGKFLVRYAQGDWQYYALGNNSFFSGIRALFWPTPAALGRQEMTGPLTEQNLSQKVVEGYESINFFSTDTNRLNSLQKKLQQQYTRHQNKQIYNKDYGLHLVPFDQTYWLFNNSNLQTASWLRELGCNVKGYSLLSNWQKD